MRYDRVLFPFISIVRSPGCPVIPVSEFWGWAGRKSPCFGGGAPWICYKKRKKDRVVSLIEGHATRQRINPKKSEVDADIDAKLRKLTEKS